MADATPSDPAMLWMMNTQPSRTPLSDAEKAAIKAAWRAANASPSTASAPTQHVPTLDGSRSRVGGVHQVAWTELGRRRLERARKLYGEDFEIDDPVAVEYRCTDCNDSGRLQRSRVVEGDGDVSRHVIQEYLDCPCGIGQKWPEWDPVAAHIPANLRARYTVWQQDTAAWERGLAWVETWPLEPPMVVLLGEPGRGKSQMACCLLALVHERHQKRVAYCNTVAFLDRIKATFDSDRRSWDEDEQPETTEDVMRELMRWPLLCLDDVGAVRGTEWAEERQYALVNGRMEAGLPTIFTANPNSPGWKSLDPRLKSRILSGITIGMTGPDRRLRRAQ